MVASAPGERLYSLDLFRGLTMAAMILVNNPGSWAHIHPPLRHAAWHGLTPTDLVFPFFLFIVGAALPFSRRLHMREPGAQPVFLPILRRSLILFGLGLFIAAFPFLNFDPPPFWHPGLLALRLPGVLQRIALCYLAAALLSRRLGDRGLLVTGASILAAYTLAMHLIPVPGYGAGVLEGRGSSLAAWVDRQLLGPAHMWKREYDPEGLLSTFPALVTTLIGLRAGRILHAARPGAERAAHLLAEGALLGAAGIAWSWFFPVNKALWTGAYVLITGGLAALGLGLCFYLADLQGRKAWGRPFAIMGRNAITLFVGSALVGRLLLFIQVGEGLSLKQWLFTRLYLPLLPPRDASLAYASSWLLLWFLLLLGLHRRRLVFKV